MPFKSEKQRRYMHANLPEIAQRWERDYASGGIARLGFANGMNLKALNRDVFNDYNTSYQPTGLRGMSFPNFNSAEAMGTNIYEMDEMNTYGQLPKGTDTIGMNEMFSYPKIKPNYNFGREIDQTYTQGNEFFTSPQKLPWYNNMFNKVGEGITGLKNKFTGGWDQSQNFIKSIMDNTIMGRIAAGFDATNPNAFNYNPALQGQIDFMKSQGMYGTNPTSGLNQITSGVLRGKNLQSGFGSNDLAKMYDKSIARTQKTIDNLSKQWSRLKEEDPEEYAKKEAYHRALLQKKQNEKKKYFDNLKKKTTTSGGDGWINKKIDQSGKGDGGGGHVRTPGSYDTDTSTGGSGDHRTASTSSSSSNKTRHHALAQGGIVSLWPK